MASSSIESKTACKPVPELWGEDPIVPSDAGGSISDETAAEVSLNATLWGKHPIAHACFPEVSSYDLMVRCMTEKQPKHKRPTASPGKKRRNRAAPTREGGTKLAASRNRAGKLKEIAKGMKEATVVADQIVALETKQNSKSSTKQKRSAVPAGALKRPVT